MCRSILIFLVFSIGCTKAQENEPNILPGANQTNLYFPSLKRKSIGVTVNHSSLIDGVHLTDSLLRSGLIVKKVFTPEHGYLGTTSDGVKIEYESTETPFELISLYGEDKKPSTSQLEGIDVMLFDIQEVGTRFYTYISTMHLVLEACAENDIPVIILDRPNPNGSYVDGPVLEAPFTSFVGMHEIPIVHGMTVGELATMVNEEGMLANGVKCDLKVIPVKNWNHSMKYSLPVKPSPNLPNDLSISLYPSLCLFEGTIMSVGRGTDFAFQQIGHPEYPDTTHSFTPQSKEGAKWPPYENEKCFGVSWIGQEPSYTFSLEPLIDAYEKMGRREDFFNDYFKRLAGTDKLQRQIEAGLSEQEIRATWENDLKAFREKREKYLLYE